ncbi:MAG: WD40 repeat domain-containing protein, partial [Planctomycetaceae bacterium]|nr:WD40 repeat domain-containing protein [Planctomycetaceae bacterium]
AELKPGESTYSEKHFELINRLQAESVSQRRDTLEEIKSLTWPADRFLRKRIPEDMLAAAGGGDASKAPKEIVALLGDPRLNCWSSVLDLRLIDKEQTVLAAHEDGTVSFHDMKSGRLIEIRKCHAHQVHSIAISPDEKTYATGGDDGAVTLWNRSSGQELITYKNHTSETYDVQFSPDEQWFASAAADGLICIYSQARQQRPIHILQPGGPVHDVQFLNQGDLLASASGDATLRIWDVKSGKQVKALTGHSGEVWVLSVSDSANRLASIDSEGKAIIWNTTNWSIVKTLNTEGTVYSKIRLSHDGKKLAVRVHNYSRNTTSLWDIESGIRVKQSLHPGGWGVFSLRFSKNDEVLVSGHRPGRIAIRDLASESFRFTKVEGPELLKGELSGDGTQLGIVHRGEFQHTWDFNKCIFRRTKATRSGNHCIATSFDGKFYVTAGGTYKPAKVDIESGKVVGVGYPAHAARVHAIQYSHDGTKIASVASDIRLLLWDAQLKEKIIIDCKGMSRLRAVTFSPDDKLVAVSGKSGKVQIRETSKGGLIATFDGKIGESHALLFSPDGKRLLQGLGNGNINIWDLATNKLVGTLKGHQATILSIKISPDGKKLASSASDGAVRFWDIKSGKNIRTIQLSPTGRGNVYIAGFTPEGRHLITTCANGMAYVLRL